MMNEKKLIFEANYNKEDLDKNRSPYQMRFSDFLSEFNSVMDSVAAKEKNGNLDPGHKSYRPMDDEEKKVFAKDWKAFSRSRGFSEEDIEEFERWLILSGQSDKLSSKNDPWRREYGPNYPEMLYCRFVEKALSEEITLNKDILRDYEEIKVMLEKNKDPNIGISQEAVGTVKISKDQDDIETW